MSVSGPLFMSTPPARLDRQATLYAACIGQLGQFGNQIYQYAFAFLYAELWGLSLCTGPWVGAFSFCKASLNFLCADKLSPPEQRLLLADRVVLAHPGWKQWAEACREPLLSLAKCSGKPLSGRALRRGCPQVSVPSS